MNLRFLALLIAMGGVVLSGRAWSDAEEPAPRIGEEVFHFQHVVGGQYAPWGVMYELRALHRWWLAPGTQHVLLRDAHIGYGTLVQLSPSFVLYGPSLTIQPLTILALGVDFGHVVIGFWRKRYGILDYNELGQFADYSYEYRSDHGGEIGSYTDEAWHLTFRAKFQIQLRRVSLLYLGRYMYFHPGEFEGIYYNYLVGITVSHKSWTTTHDVMLLVDIVRGEKDTVLRLGLDSNTLVVHDDGDATPLKTTAQWKIGPMLAWTFSDELFGAVQQPTVIGFFHFYARDAIAEEGAKRPIGAAVALRFATDWYE